jgi:hypothetical protein
LAELNDKREDGMPERFEEKMEVVFEQHPELKEKSSIDVLFTMGAVHSARLSRVFKENGISLERDFPVSPDYIFSYSAELYRSLSNGLEPQETLLEKAYAENVLNVAWLTVVKPQETMPDGLSYERFAISHFTHEQIEHLFQLVHATEKLDDWKGIVEYLNSVLRENDIPELPSNSNNFDNAVAVMREHLPRSPASDSELKDETSKRPRSSLARVVLDKFKGKAA